VQFNSWAVRKAAWFRRRGPAGGPRNFCLKSHSTSGSPLMPSFVSLLVWVRKRLKQAVQGEIKSSTLPSFLSLTMVVHIPAAVRCVNYQVRFFNNTWFV